MERYKKFVINLKRRPQRLKRFLDSCPLSFVKVIEGFDGVNYINEPETKQGIVKKFSLQTRGEVGCFLSHMRIYQEIVRENIQRALILEDDAIFSKNFTEKLEKVITELPKDFIIAYIGGRFQENFVMNPNTCIPISENIVQHKYPLQSWVDVDRTTHAYIISNAGAKLVLSQFESSQIIDCPFDKWLLFKALEKNNVKIYNSTPLLCHSALGSESDVRDALGNYPNVL